MVDVEPVADSLPQIPPTWDHMDQNAAWSKASTRPHRLARIILFVLRRIIFFPFFFSLFFIYHRHPRLGTRLRGGNFMTDSPCAWSEPEHQASDAGRLSQATTIDRNLFVSAHPCS